MSPHRAFIQYSSAITRPWGHPRASSKMIGGIADMCSHAECFIKTSHWLDYGN